MYPLFLLLFFFLLFDVFLFWNMNLPPWKVLKTGYITLQSAYCSLVIIIYGEETGNILEVQWLITICKSLDITSFLFPIYHNFMEWHSVWVLEKAHINHSWDKGIWDQSQRSLGILNYKLFFFWNKWIILSCGHWGYVCKIQIIKNIFMIIQYYRHFHVMFNCMSLPEFSGVLLTQI